MTAYIHFLLEVNVLWFIPVAFVVLLAVRGIQSLL